MQKTGRNEPCPCDSGKKYKHCCGKLESQEDPNALHSFGVSAYLAGKTQEAEEMLRRVVASKPESAEAHNDLGLALLTLGKLDESIVEIHRALAIRPEFAEAHNNLGCALYKLDRVAESIACFREAVEIKPTYAEAQKNLGDLLGSTGQHEEAATRYRNAIAINPAYAEAYFNLAGVHYSRGRSAEALECYRQVIRFVPDHPIASHLVATLAGEQLEHASPEYIERVFNGYAGSFETHLVQDLKYDIPEKMAALLQEYAPHAEKKWRVLDLGCGTGLVAEKISMLAEQLTGVDLSAKMLEVAEKKRLYTRLVKADLFEFMRSEAAASYDVITAADVFVYAGKIDTASAEAHRLLAEGGLFSFSIEELDASELPPNDNAESPGYALTSSGRFAHSPALIKALANKCGFRVLRMEPTRIRFNKGEPVNGWLALWEKANPIA